MLSAAATGQQGFARGDYEQAADQYRRALARARRQDEPSLVGDQAYNLAVCLLAMGQINEAGERLVESEASRNGRERRQSHRVVRAVGG